MPTLFNKVAGTMLANDTVKDASLLPNVFPRYVIYYGNDTTRYRIIGSVCAVAVVLILTVAAVLWWRRKKKRDNQLGHPSVQLRDMTTISGNATELGATLTNNVSALTRSQFDYIPRSIAKGNNGSCNLCMSAIVTGDEIVNLHPCNHKYHTDCARSWFTQNSTMCPICGTDMVKAMGLPPQIYDSSKDYNARNSFMNMSEFNHSYSYHQNNIDNSVVYPTAPDQAHYSIRPNQIL